MATVSPSWLTWLEALTDGVASLSLTSILMLDLYSSAFCGLDKAKVNALLSSSKISSIVVKVITPSVSPAEITIVPLAAT